MYYWSQTGRVDDNGGIFCIVFPQLCLFYRWSTHPNFFFWSDLIQLLKQKEDWLQINTFFLQINTFFLHYCSSCTERRCMRLLQALPACGESSSLLLLPFQMDFLHPDGFSASRWTLGHLWALAATTKLLSFSSRFSFPCSVIPTALSSHFFYSCTLLLCSLLRGNLNYSNIL